MFSVCLKPQQTIRVSTLCVIGRVRCVFCSFVTTVLTVDVMSHFLAVGYGVSTLHTGVAPPGVLPKDASAAGYTLILLPDSR